MNLDLFLNPRVSPNRGLVLSAESLRPVAMPNLVLGDTLSLRAFICDGEGGIDDASGDATFTLRVAIGLLGGAPTGGTFSLTYGGYTVTGLAHNATAAAVQAALQSIPTIGTNNVLVTGAAPVYTVEFVGSLANGNRSEISGSGGSLTPQSNVTVVTLQDGGGGLNEKQLIRLVLLPYTEQTTWKTITDGWSGTLPINTVEFANALGDDPFVALTLEVELTDQDGYRRTVVQVPVTVFNEVITQALATYAPLDPAELRYIRNRWDLLHLTGGGALRLDGIDTLSWPVGRKISCRIAGVDYSYQLTAGTDAESSPEVIRPDDYNGSTNAKVWLLDVAAGGGGVSYGTVDPSSAPPGNSGIYYRTDTGGVWVWNPVSVEWDSIIA